MTTILDRRAQFHQARLTEHTTPLNPTFNSAFSSAAHVFGAGNSGNGPYALLMRVLQQQADMLSYIDCFWLLGITFGLLLPLIFMMRKTQPGRAASAH